MYAFLLSSDEVNFKNNILKFCQVIMKAKDVTLIFLAFVPLKSYSKCHIHSSFSHFFLDFFFPSRRMLSGMKKGKNSSFIISENVSHNALIHALEFYRNTSIEKSISE